MSAGALPKRLTGRRVLSPCWQWLDLLPDDDSLCASLKAQNTPISPNARVAVLQWSDGAFSRMTFYGGYGDTLPPLDEGAVELSYTIARAHLERIYREAPL